jgi:DNA-binding MarR family transcriptional regulator
VSAAIATDPIVDQILDELEPLVARQRRAVARHGCLRAISSTHLHVLFLLECEGTQAMGHLAEQMGASLPNLTGIIDRMVERGLVERLRDEDDRRVVMVGATPAGRAAVEEIDMVRRRQFGRLIETLTPEQQERALRTFRDLRQAAERIED